MVFNTTFSSSLTSQGTIYLGDYFNIQDKQELALPISLFLIGYVFGPIIFAPLSEVFGRRVVMVPSYAVLTLATFGCALAPTWGALLAFRLVVGFCASIPFTLGGALFADMWPDPVPRGRAIMAFLVVRIPLFRYLFLKERASLSYTPCQSTCIGPVFGPIVCGYWSDVLPIGWRFPFYINLMAIGLSWPLVFFLPGQSPRSKEAFGRPILFIKAKVDL